MLVTIPSSTQRELLEYLYTKNLFRRQIPFEMLIGIIYDGSRVYDFYICRMRRYKVLFKNNKAISASFTGENFGKHLKIAKEDNKKIIESFVVWGDNEEDAIEVATKTASEIFKIINYPVAPSFS